MPFIHPRNNTDFWQVVRHRTIKTNHCQENSSTNAKPCTQIAIVRQKTQHFQKHEQFRHRRHPQQVTERIPPHPNNQMGLTERPLRIIVSLHRIHVLLVRLDANADDFEFAQPHPPDGVLIDALPQRAGLSSHGFGGIVVVAAGAVGVVGVTSHAAEAMAPHEVDLFGIPLVRSESDHEVGFVEGEIAEGEFASAFGLVQDGSGNDRPSRQHFDAVKFGPGLDGVLVGNGID
mmetsp:Transcript_16242/g.34300  ORF Transcript_16242/g.34300 Transcript_16242/m.34300 type:complete len:232 (+) Transcript_16242:633-1328(+)